MNEPTQDFSPPNVQGPQFLKGSESPIRPIAGSPVACALLDGKEIHAVLAALLPRSPRAWDRTTSEGREGHRAPGTSTPGEGASAASEAPSLRRLDRMLLAAASRPMPRKPWPAFVVRPETMLRWHRELVRKKWTYKRRGRPGRPPIDPEVRDLIVRLGRENPRWGYQRIRGELLKLDIQVSATTVRTILLRLGLEPSPRRGVSSAGAAPLRPHPRSEVVAADPRIRWGLGWGGGRIHP